MKVDIIIFSPPFASSTIEKKFKSTKDLENFTKGQKWLLSHGRSIEGIKRFIAKDWQGYSNSKDNIGMLKYGVISGDLE